MPYLMILNIKTFINLTYKEVFHVYHLLKISKQWADIGKKTF